MGEDVSGSAYKFSTYQTNENRPYDQRVTHLHAFKKSNSDRPLLLSVGDGIDPRPIAFVVARGVSITTWKLAKELKTNTNSGVTKPYPAK